MNAKDLLDGIDGYKDQLPKVRSVVHAYAQVLAPLADRLTEEELKQIIALGALINARSSQLVPVLTWKQAGELPAQGKQIA